MMSEAFHLFVFDHTGRVLVRSTGYAWLVIAVGLAGAYVPPLLGLDWHMGLAAFLLHPASISAFAAAGALCLYYIAAGYPGYARKLPRSLDLNFLLSSMLKTASGSSFKEVEVREADAALSSEALAKLQRLADIDTEPDNVPPRHRVLIDIRQQRVQQLHADENVPADAVRVPEDGVILIAYNVASAFEP